MRLTPLWKVPPGGRPKTLQGGCVDGREGRGGEAGGGEGADETAAVHVVRLHEL